MHGLGSYHFASGDIYTGQYEAGKMHGHGRYTYSNGDYVEGEFIEGSMPAEPSASVNTTTKTINGSPLRTQKSAPNLATINENSESNRGDNSLKNSLKSSTTEGGDSEENPDQPVPERTEEDTSSFIPQQAEMEVNTLTNSDSQTELHRDRRAESISAQKEESGVYEGDLNDQGQKEGNGRMIYDNGDTYSGTWKRNVKHGYGTLTYANGDVYVGDFAKGRKHGMLLLFVFCSCFLLCLHCMLFVTTCSFMLGKAVSDTMNNEC